MASIFRALFYQPIFNTLVVFYRLLGDNLGWAIFVIAILSRVITFPMTSVQMKSAKKGKDFQKKYDALKKKYAKNKDKLNEELAKLQAKYLPGQLSGCLPIIILILFLIQVRSVIRAIVDQGTVAFNDVAYPFIAKFSEDAVVNLQFLGMDLSKVAADFSWTDKAIVPYVIVSVLVGVSQLASTYILSSTRMMGSRGETKKKKSSSKTGDKEGMSDIADIMSTTSKQMMFMFPILTIITSLGYWGGAKVFPSGVSLFWTVQSMFVIIQQVITNRSKVISWMQLKFSKIGIAGRE